MPARSLDARATIFIMALAQFFAKIFTVEVAHSGEELTGTPYKVCVAQYSAGHRQTRNHGPIRNPGSSIQENKKIRVSVVLESV